MTYLQPGQGPPRPARLSPAEHAAEMRARADEATSEKDRAYWLWLAAEWDKAAHRHRPPPRSWGDE